MTDMASNPVSGATALMLYDGLCGLCNWNVRWFLKHDRQDRIRFATQQSPLAERALARHGIDRDAMLAANSVYLIIGYEMPGEQLLCRSDVPIQLLRLLGGGWGLLGRLLGAIPRSLRDAVYSVVARNRFRIGGRYESCPLPTVEERAKFLA